MASVQSFTLAYDASNIQAGITSADSGVEMNVNVSALGKNVALRGTSTSAKYATLNDFAKSFLFPNAKAKPIKADVSCVAFGSWAWGGNNAKGYYQVDGTNVADWSFKAGIVSYTANKATAGITANALTKCTKSSTLKIGMSASNGSAGFVDGSITFYFNRYDFTASAGDGVGSVSVSSATGYDGDTVTYSCNLQSDYTFDGWYSGDTKVSTLQTYVHTVNGSDLTLTAKAKAQAPTTRKVTVTYDGNSIIAIDEPISGSVRVVYDGRNIFSTSVMVTGTHTLTCAGKVMQTDLIIGNKTLKCAGKKMMTDVVVIIT